MKKEDGCLRAPHDQEHCTRELVQRFTDLDTEIWECTYHSEQSLQRNRELNERYPDSPNPPSWFDPTIAGESWDED